MVISITLLPFESLKIFNMDIISCQNSVFVGYKIDLSAGLMFDSLPLNELICSFFSSLI